MEHVLDTPADSTPFIGFTEDQVGRLKEHLREAARNDFAQRVTLESLSPEHHAVFVRALNNVLSTGLALITFAQIVGGLPIADVGWDRRLNGLDGDHPLDEHEELCPGTMEKARELREKWDPSSLKFSPVVSAVKLQTPSHWEGLDNTADYWSSIRNELFCS